MCAKPFTAASADRMLRAVIDGAGLGTEYVTAGLDQRPATPSSAPQDSSGDLLFIGVAAAVMVVITTFNSLNVLHEHVESGHPLRPWEPVLWEGSSAVYFLAAAPLMFAVIRRFWPLDRPVAVKVSAQLLAAVLISLGHVLAIGAIRWAAYRASGSRYDAFGPLKDWPYELRKDLITYVSVAAVYVGWRLLRTGSEAAKPGGADVLEVRDGARRHFVPLSDVLWVEAAGNYVELHRAASGLLHRASLSDMERRLAGEGFVRIHRSRLVRRDAIAAVQSKPTGDFLVSLKDGRELAGSRRYRRPLLAD